MSAKNKNRVAISAAIRPPVSLPLFHSPSPNEIVAKGSKSASPTNMMSGARLVSISSGRSSPNCSCRTTAIQRKAVGSELDVRRLARARPTQTFLKRRSTFTSKCSTDIFDNLDNSARFHEGVSNGCGADIGLKPQSRREACSLFVVSRGVEVC